MKTEIPYRRRKTGNTESDMEWNKIGTSGEIIIQEKVCTEQDICLRDIHKVQGEIN